MMLATAYTDDVGDNNSNNNNNNPKLKARQRNSSSKNLSRALSISSRTLSSDQLEVTNFQRSDRVDGDYILSYLEYHPEVEGLRCEEVLSDQYVQSIHRFLVNYHTSIHLTTLELPKNGLTSACGNALAEILQMQVETLQKLDLSNNPLSEAGLSALLGPLIAESRPSKLRVLTLHEIGLGSKGATLIATILRDNKSIEELNLSRNKLGATGMTRLAADLKTNSTLQHLDISFNNIKKKGAAVVADALRTSTVSNLRVLDVSGNDLRVAGVQAFAKLLAEGRHLEGFYVGGNAIGPEGASYLGNALNLNYTLKDLRLENNQIGDGGLWMLVDGLLENEHRTSSVERLGLGWNDIGLEGAASLATALKHNGKLAYIDLTSNKICCSGAEALAESLSYNLSLRELILARNQIRDPGAFALAMAMGKPSCSVNKLNCQENPISDEGKKSLDRALQVRRNQIYWLGQLLRDLSKGAVASINLVDRCIGDEELLLLTDVLAEDAPFLKTFWISGTDLSARSLLPFCDRALMPPSNIVRLYIKNCDCGDDVAKSLACVLSANTTLEVLSFTDSFVFPEGASALAEGLKGNTTLRRLNLDRNQVGDVGMESLASTLSTTSSLVSLSVSRNLLTDLCMGLEGLKYLEELHLNRNRISDLGALEFCRFLMDDCKLVWLSLRDNNLTQRGGETLKTFLPSTAVVEY